MGLRAYLGLTFAAVLAACSDGQAPRPASVSWTPGRPIDTAELPAVRGMREYRGIVHLHSYLSHDACDGHQRSDFTDAQCLRDLREGICRTRQDFVYLTDHPAFFADH